jgi:ammonia channel protein AmtB
MTYATMLTNQSSFCDTANVYGKKLNTLVQTVIIMSSMIAFLWIILSLSLVWGRDANGDQIMGFPKQFYMFAHAGNLPIVELASNIPMNIFAVFELSFAIITPTIVAASVIGKFAASPCVGRAGCLVSTIHTS